MSKALKGIVPIIIVLTIVAALGGLWPAEVRPYETLNFRGERITVNARGLYYWDTLSSAAQMQANDLVTLVVGVLLLLVGYFASLRGRLLLAGSLGLILYTSIAMCARGSTLAAYEAVLPSALCGAVSKNRASSHSLFGAAGLSRHLPGFDELTPDMGETPDVLNAVSTVQVIIADVAVGLEVPAVAFA